MDESDKHEVLKLVKWLVFLIAVALAVGIALMRLSPPPGPKTLADANLVNRVWSKSEVEQARRVTYWQLRAIADALDRAAKKGDEAIVLAVMPQATSVLASWNDQSADTKLSGRDCILAALHVIQALDTAATPMGWSRTQFDAAMADCKP